MKKLLLAIILSVFCGMVYAQLPDTINAGSYVGDTDADSVRNAFIKVNNNDQYLEESIRDDTTTSKKTFWFGYGLPGDTVYADASYGVGAGHYVVNEDSLRLTKILTNMSDGDTLDYSYVFNDSLGVTTDCDTIVSINGSGVTGADTTLTFLIDIVPENNYIWIEIDGTEDGSNPVWFRSDMFGILVRD